MRIEDFTALRLKQRSEAANDWILFLDSDEWLSDGAVDDIRSILKTAEPKTIIKIPRYPVIDGTPYSRSVIGVESVPRIHNRLSGCTMKSDKRVHEKFAYDDTFREVSTRHPLYNELPSVDELRAKDGRYITLEVERIQSQGYPWNLYVRWVLLREPMIITYLALRMLCKSPMYMRKDTVPFAHDWRYVRYHGRLFRAITGAMLAHPFTAGRVGNQQVAE
jgi:hypothetical protein